MFRAFVLLFIIKTRFSKNRNLHDIILTRYGLDTLKMLRNFENNKRKLEKLKLDIDFLKRCKAYQIIPKFIKFKLFTQRLYNINL